jgi:hypothetical protein
MPKSQHQESKDQIAKSETPKPKTKQTNKMIKED